MLWTLFPQVGRGGGGESGTQLFLVMPNMRLKNFPFIKHSGLFLQVRGPGLFLVMPNLRSKFFSFI